MFYGGRELASCSRNPCWKNGSGGNGIRTQVSWICLVFWAVFLLLENSWTIPDWPWTVSDYDTVIYSKKYLFGLHSYLWHRAPKTLGLSWVLRLLKVTFVMLMRWLRLGGWWPMEPITGLKGWNFPSYSLASGEGRGLETDFKHQWPRI